ncbi:MAG: 50S ribosomal protein L11 methyltransferase [Micavibrio aeruginosavorus]|uniref:50S ribosomal protein L11 methyltransferase n=1 Tax=Micavibrio aeruginosavorus TaxID=349221 RepID=A0A2W5FNR4_9BACT|nr:MAG: 50S ribosomal protein L11 methyltransferase [Micavibrio aeruginosavorus]
MLDAQIKGLLFTINLSQPLSLSDTEIMTMASLLEDEAISTSWEKSKNAWDIMWLVDFRPNAAQIAKRLKVQAAKLKIEPVADTNWLEHSYQQFPPFRIGDFFIYGSHYKEKIPAKTMGLQIDAATAFGSGEHGTTKGCLEMLIRMKDMGIKPKNILDMGTGSGILALGAYRLWKKPVLAIDNDPESVRVSCRHRSMNKIPAGAEGVACACGDGYKTHKVKQTAPFDLVIANILAGPLIEMAPELAGVLKPKGYVILSGLLRDQEKAVLAAHKEFGMKKIARIVHDDWCALLLQAES